MMVILVIIPFNEFYTLIFYTDIVTVGYISPGTLVNSAIIINIHTVQAVDHRTAPYLHVQIAVSTKYVYARHCKNEYGYYDYFFQNHPDSPGLYRIEWNKEVKRKHKPFSLTDLVTADGGNINAAAVGLPAPAAQ